MFYRIIENKLYDYADYMYADDCKEIEGVTMDEYNADPIKYIVSGDELILNPDYETEAAAQREADFKAKFFEISSYGWFRKVPKGYQSAVECLNLAFNNVSILGKLPAETLIFYAQPDFTKLEECTEEWLIAHQTKNTEMSAQEFGAFYAGFSVAWNNTEHN